jgi:hypothetical protein
MPVKRSAPQLRNPFPSIDLEKAYEYLARILEKFPGVTDFQRNQLLVEALRFPENSGTGHNAIGALSHYGLLVRLGSKENIIYHLTDEAKKLHFSHSTKAWRDQAMKAATNPILFGFLYSQYGDKELPHSIRTTLIKKYKEVNNNNIGAILSRYKKSIEFAQNTEIIIDETQVDQTKIQDNILTKKLVSEKIDIEVGNGVTISIPKDKLIEIIKTYYLS